MSLVSNLFLFFVLFSVVLYYLVPKKCQWVVLLIFSMLYYIAGGARYLFFLFFSIGVTYLFGRIIARMIELEKDPKTIRRVVALGVILNIGLLGVVKYTNFIVENMNSWFHMDLKGLEILFPLGISFYTFQSTGYLLDVYWKRVKAEKNLFKYALFVSFFPQLLQGPIGRYDRLAGQLYESHTIEWKRIALGIERILWGFFKKMVVADWAAIYADAIFQDVDKYHGIAFLGVLLYTLQLYADFSGGMDVVIGIASMFGITLDENFRQPFFAVSLTDFWHRWHITLGTWMKDYVFYPITLSKWMNKFGKWGKKAFGRKVGRTLPTCVANLIVFLLVGIWHGAAWRFILYGLYNGIIIAFSGLMMDNYRKWKKALHISGKEKWYYVFTIIRTFLIVVISNFFDRADSIKDAMRMMVLSVTSFEPSQILLISAGKNGVAFTPWALLIIACGVLMIFAVSVYHERGGNIWERTYRLPLPVSTMIWFGVLLLIGLFGSSSAARGFLYAQF